MTSKRRQAPPATSFSAVADEALGAWQAARRQVLCQSGARDALHQWRICSRRLTALEALLAPRARPAPGLSLQRLLEEAFDAAGKLRDTQLAIEQLELAAARDPVALQVARHLRHRLPKHRAKLLRKLTAVKPRQLRRCIDAWRGAHPDAFEARALRRGAGRLARLDRTVTADVQHQATGRTLHRQRLRLKQLRYMREAWRAAGGSGDACTWTAGRLAVRQRHLGAITDRAMLLRIIARHGREHPRRRAALAALAARLQRQRRR